LIDSPAIAARHGFYEKQGKINESYKKLQNGWLDSGDKLDPSVRFVKVGCSFTMLVPFFASRPATLYMLGTFNQIASQR